MSVSRATGVLSQHYYDIGVAVGTERGLVVPVLRECRSEGLRRHREGHPWLRSKAKNGTLSIADLTGGVFTISNGGVYGSMLSTPILNAPQSAILGMHTIQQRAVVVDGQIVIRPMMYLALSYDHRVVDGKEAVTFLVRVGGDASKIRLVCSSVRNGKRVRSAQFSVLRSSVRVLVRQSTQHFELEHFPMFFHPDNTGAPTP